MVPDETDPARSPTYGTPPPYGTPDGAPTYSSPVPGAWAEVRAGARLLAFDGRVLEIFNFQVDGYPVAVRFHISNMSLKIVGPNRKGRRSLRVEAPNCSLQVWVTVQADEWATVGPFISRVAAALPLQDGLQTW